MNSTNNDSEVSGFPMYVWLIFGVAFVSMLLAMYVGQRRSEHKETLLFEKDGCKVYSFYDNSKKHYFVNCVTLQTSSTTYDGDSTIVTENKGS